MFAINWFDHSGLVRRTQPLARRQVSDISADLRFHSSDEDNIVDNDVGGEDDDVDAYGDDDGIKYQNWC